MKRWWKRWRRARNLRRLQLAYDRLARQADRAMGVAVPKGTRKAQRRRSR